MNHMHLFEIGSIIVFGGMVSILVGYRFIKALYAFYSLKRLKSDNLSPEEKKLSEMVLNETKSVKGVVFSYAVTCVLAFYENGWGWSALAGLWFVCLFAWLLNDVTKKINVSITALLISEALENEEVKVEKHVF